MFNDSLIGMHTWHTAPMGEAALLIEHMSPDVAVANPAVIALSRRLRRHVAQIQLRGIESIMPAIQSVLIRFDPCQCSGLELDELVQQVLAQDVQDDKADGAADKSMSSIVRIAVCYGGEAGPDLEAVAHRTKLTPHDVIALHTAQPLRVLMMGFAPGFAYLGPLPDALLVPRRSSPRTAVPAGSVAIAAGMTGIYPARLPGGWHIIGRTRETLFDPAQQPPSRVEPGGWVQFVSMVGEDESA